MTNKIIFKKVSKEQYLAANQDKSDMVWDSVKKGVDYPNPCTDEIKKLYDISYLRNADWWGPLEDRKLYKLSGFINYDKDGNIKYYLSDNYVPKEKTDSINFREVTKEVYESFTWNCDTIKRDWADEDNWCTPKSISWGKLYGTIYLRNVEYHTKKEKKLYEMAGFIDSYEDGSLHYFLSEDAYKAVYKRRREMEKLYEIKNKVYPNGNWDIESVKKEYPIMEEDTEIENEIKDDIIRYENKVKEIEHMLGE